MAEEEQFADREPPASMWWRGSPEQGAPGEPPARRAAAGQSGARCARERRGGRWAITVVAATAPPGLPRRDLPTWASTPHCRLAAHHPSPKRRRSFRARWASVWRVYRSAQWKISRVLDPRAALTASPSSRAKSLAPSGRRKHSRTRCHWSQPPWILETCSLRLHPCVFTPALNSAEDNSCPPPLRRCGRATMLSPSLLSRPSPRRAVVGLS